MKGLRVELGAELTRHPALEDRSVSMVFAQRQILRVYMRDGLFLSCLTEWVRRIFDKT
jgi:hypothetical protein